MGKTIYYKTITGQKLTPEQIAELEKAEKLPIVYDDDCPESSPDMIKAFKKAAILRKRNMVKV